MIRNERREYRRKREAVYEMTLIWDHSIGSQTQTILLPGYVARHIDLCKVKHKSSGDKKAVCCKAAY